MSRAKPAIVRGACAALISLMLLSAFVKARGAGAVLSAEVSVDLSGRRQPIDRRIYGQFLEHFGRMIQGGLWAELLLNRKFYPIDPNRSQVAEPWKPEKGRSNVSYVVDLFESFNGVSSQRVSLFGDSKVWRGISQAGFDIQAGREYTAYAWIKSDRAGETVAFRLESSEGKEQTQAEAQLRESAEGEWNRYEVRLRPSRDIRQAVFRILFSTPGARWIGAASLMPSDNIAGMRPDVLALIKAMAPPIIRWPGGGYPDAYDWRRAIGPRDRRIPLPRLPFGQPYGHDHGMDPNDFGVDEFLKFCELIGAEPYITANFGSGTPEMAANWVEYCNGPATSRWGARRAANGHATPYGVKSWSIGNEIWGVSFQSGFTTAEGYAYFYTPIARAMRAVDPSIRITAVGQLGNLSAQDDSWNETTLKNAWKDIDLLSIHHYFPGGFRAPMLQNRPLPFYHAIVADPWALEKSLRALIGRMDAITGGEKKIQIALDEWNEWDWDYDLPQDRPERSAVNQFIDLVNRSGLEFNHTARDGLFNARMLHMMMRLSHRVPIGVRTHMINSLGAIRTDSARSFQTASGVFMQLYTRHSGDALIPLTQVSPSFDVPEQDWKQVPYLDATATVQGDKFFLHLLNLHPAEEMEVRVNFGGGAIRPAGVLRRIAPGDFMARNDFDVNAVVIEERKIDSLRSGMIQKLPPHSATILEGDIQK